MFVKVQDFRFRLDDLVAYESRDCLGSDNPELVVSLHFRNKTSHSVYFGLDEDVRKFFLDGLDSACIGSDKM